MVNAVSEASVKTVSEGHQGVRMVYDIFCFYLDIVSLLSSQVQITRRMAPEIEKSDLSKQLQPLFPTWQP